MRICVEHLAFNYTSETILDDVTFNIEEGVCVSILGPNGAGKTTLLKCIDRLLQYKRGTIKLDEENLRELSHEELSQRVGYVPQATGSLFPIKVFDMVLMGRSPYITWQSSNYDQVKVLTALEKLNIKNLAMKNFNEISGGQQQKVIIARALAQETNILLLDEPISSLDIRHQMEVMDIVRDLVTQLQITAVMVLHDLNIAGRYSDKIVIMNKGRIFAIGSPKEILTKENIAKVYGIEAHVESIAGKPCIVPIRVN